jgi:phosphate-selective porin
VRYDDFKVRPAAVSGSPLSDEDGDALTLGWTWAVREHVELAAEWLQVDSDVGNRAALGEAAVAREQSLQLAIRLSL